MFFRRKRSNSSIIDKGRSLVARHGFWFIDIPRTSSSSMRFELSKCFDSTHGKNNVLDESYATQQIFQDHQTALQMLTLLGKSIWESIFTFAMVRNPWDRIFSMYNYRKMKCNIPKEWSFRDYILALRKSSPADIFTYHGFRYGASQYVLGENGELIVDYIAKYENRYHDLQLIASRLNIDKLGEVFIQRATPKNTHYSHFYDDETKEIIRNLYAKDIELFDYEFEDKA